VEKTIRCRSREESGKGFGRKSLPSTEKSREKKKKVIMKRPEKKRLGREKGSKRDGGPWIREGKKIAMGVRAGRTVAGGKKQGVSQKNLLTQGGKFITTLAIKRKDRNHSTVKGVSKESSLLVQESD